MEPIVLAAITASVGLAGFVLHGTITSLEYLRCVADGHEGFARRMRRAGAGLLYVAAVMAVIHAFQHTEDKRATVAAMDSSVSVKDHGGKRVKFFFSPELTERERQGIWWDFESYLLNHPRVRSGGETLTGDIWYKLLGAESGL